MIVKEKNKNFAKQVEEVLNNNYPKTDMIIVTKHTPKLLQKIGLKDLPITITQRHLKTTINKHGNYQGANYHNLGIKLIQKLPEAISTPLKILKSDTRDDSIVIVTKLLDKKENPVIVSIKIDGKGIINNIEIDSNVLTNAYGRRNYNSFIKRNITKGNLLYDIKKGTIKKK